MRLSIFILGVIGITAQSVFLREVLATFQAGEFTIGAALFFWLLWTSVGSGVLGRLTRKTSDPVKVFHELLPWYGLMGYVGVCAVSGVPYLARLTPGELVPFDIQFTAVALSFLPFNVLGGLLFSVGVKALEYESRVSSGHVYRIEAWGAALAGALVSIVLVNIITNNTIALLCPALALGTSMKWSAGRKSPGFVFGFLLLLCLAFLAAAVLWHGRASSYYFKGQSLLGEKETRYGRIRVTRNVSEITFYSDASTLFSFPDRETSEYTAHIPLLSADTRSNVLVLGGGPGGVIDEVLKYRSVEHITCVELDPALFEMSRRYLPEPWRNDPRVETVVADGRAFLDGTDRRFDVIIMNMPPPLSGLTNRYYTKEFFRLASSRLTDTGIIAFSLTGAENYIPDYLAEFLATIEETLRSAFPSVIALPGVRVRFIASNRPGQVDTLGWEELVARRRELNLETLYVRDYFLRFTMSPLRMEMLREALDTVEAPPVNSDSKPSGYFLRTVVQGNLDESMIIGFAERLAEPRLLVLFATAVTIFLALLAAVPGKGAVGRSVAAAIVSVGMTEISLEIMAIMAYQSVFGYLYGRIALLVGSYMAGLAMGARYGTMLAEKGHADTKTLALIQWGIATVPLLWMLVLALHTIFPGRLFPLEISFYLLTALSGIAGGVQFPVADTLYRSSHGRRAGPGTVYGADLAGSSIGALVTGSFLIPVLGIFPMLTFLTVLNGVTAAAVRSGKE